MAALGVAASTAAPPLWRVLWWAGVDIAPPLFMRFAALFAICGSGYTLGIGLSMWFSLWVRHRAVDGASIAAVLGAGLLFGLTMATYYRWLARRHALPAWADY